MYCYYLGFAIIIFFRKNAFIQKLIKSDNYCFNWGSLIYCNNFVDNPSGPVLCLFLSSLIILVTVVFWLKVEGRGIF